MNILICCEFYYPSIGGVQEVIKQVAERLVTYGHNVTVVTSKHSSRTSNIINGVKIREFEVSGNYVTGMQGEILLYQNFLVQEHADIILIKAAQQWTFDASWKCLDFISAKKIFIPCGFSCMYHYEYKEYYRNLPHILRKFDRLIFYSKNYRDLEFAKKHHIMNVSFVTNGASEQEFSDIKGCLRGKLNINNNDFVIMTVGSPIASKGHLALCRALDLMNIPDHNVTLVLNGNWQDFEKSRSSEHGQLGSINQIRLTGYKAYDFFVKYGFKVFVLKTLQKLKIKFFDFLVVFKSILSKPAGITIYEHNKKSFQMVLKNVQSSGNKKIICVNLDRSDLLKLYKSADLFVFASMVEYSPLVIFESCAAGLPFLTVPVGNAEEIVEWTQGGVLCPARKDVRGYVDVNPKILAENIELLMHNKQLLSHLGKSGRISWKQRFTWAHIAREYEKIFLDCLSSF